MIIEVGMAQADLELLNILLRKATFQRQCKGFDLHSLKFCIESSLKQVSILFRSRQHV